MRRLVLGVLVVLSLVGVGWGADEACTTGSFQCSKEIAASDANSEVSFGFIAGQVIVRNASGSANTVFVSWSTTPATASADAFTPVLPGQQFSIDGIRTAFVNIITGASGSATVQVDAFRQQ